MMRKSRGLYHSPEDGKYRFSSQQSGYINPRKRLLCSQESINFSVRNHSEIEITRSTDVSSIHTTQGVDLNINGHLFACTLYRNVDEGRQYCCSKIPRLVA
jgi:hypothetical protein